MRTFTRLGIMGGTFDPVHLGHLVAAEEALVQYNLDRVVFMPAGSPAMKADQRVTSAEHRYNMTLIATAGNPDFDVSRLEIDRPGLTYTVDTLVALREVHGPATELFFITGADAVWDIVAWKDAHRVADMCTFIAATRPGYDLDAVLSSHERESTAFRIEHMEVPALSISSSDIRLRIAARRPIRYLVPESVAAYIAKYGLYREDVA